MVTPGQTSGSSSFSLSNAELIFEAFDRCRVRPAAITRHHMLSARNSINLLLRDWDISTGPNLWKMVGPTTINLVQGQATYVLPANIVMLTELYYTTVNGNGAGYNSDRIMVPVTRTQYAQLPNKLQPGTPTQFWYQQLAVPQITIWQPAYSPAPNYVLNYFALQRIQDANIGSGESPDVVYRGLEALCTGLAKRLFIKFGDPNMMQTLYPELKEQAQTAWDNFASQDQEQGPMIMTPNVSSYGNMR